MNPENTIFYKERFITLWRQGKGYRQSKKISYIIVRSLIEDFCRNKEGSIEVIYSMEILKIAKKFSVKFVLEYLRKFSNFEEFKTEFHDFGEDFQDYFMQKAWEMEWNENELKEKNKKIFKILMVYFCENEKGETEITIFKDLIRITDQVSPKTLLHLLKKVGSSQKLLAEISNLCNGNIEKYFLEYA